jgi:hypothetical protein
VAFILNYVLDIEPSKQETRDQNRVVKVLTSLGWWVRIAQADETDPEKLAKGKKRKSVRIYSRKESIENPIPFTAGMTKADIDALRGNKTDEEVDEAFGDSV